MNLSRRSFLTSLIAAVALSPLVCRMRSGVAGIDHLPPAVNGVGYEAQIYTLRVGDGLAHRAVIKTGNESTASGREWISIESPTFYGNQFGDSEMRQLGDSIRYVLGFKFGRPIDTSNMQYLGKLVETIYKPCS